MTDQKGSTNEVVYIRRCHVCGGINESHMNSIKNCSQCGKNLVPFLFCSDVGAELVKTESFFKDLKESSRSTLLRSDYPPICGISLYW